MTVQFIGDQLMKPWKEGFWKFHTDGETYREKMIELSTEALTNMEESPLFLRFVSLLIDDTNNMMGHGMKSLQEIRTLEIKQQQAEGKLQKSFMRWLIRGERFASDLRFNTVKLYFRKY